MAFDALADELGRLSLGPADDPRTLHGGAQTLPMTPPIDSGMLPHWYPQGQDPHAQVKLVTPLICTLCGEAHGGVPVKRPSRSGSEATHFGSGAPESCEPDPAGSGDGALSQLGGLSQSEKEHPLHEPFAAATTADDLHPEAAPRSAQTDAEKLARQLLQFALPTLLSPPHPSAARMEIATISGTRTSLVSMRRVVAGSRSVPRFGWPGWRN